MDRVRLATAEEAAQEPSGHAGSRASRRPHGRSSARVAQHRSSGSARRCSDCGAAAGSGSRAPGYFATTSTASKIIISLTHA